MNHYIREFFTIDTLDFVQLGGCGFGIATGALATQYTNIAVLVTLGGLVMFAGMLGFSIYSRIEAAENATESDGDGDE